MGKGKIISVYAEDLEALRSALEQTRGYCQRNGHLVAAAHLWRHLELLETIMASPARGGPEPSRAAAPPYVVGYVGPPSRGRRLCCRRSWLEAVGKAHRPDWD